MLRNCDWENCIVVVEYGDAWRSRLTPPGEEANSGAEIVACSAEHLSWVEMTRRNAFEAHASDAKLRTLNDVEPLASVIVSTFDANGAHLSEETVQLRSVDGEPAYGEFRIAPDHAVQVSLIVVTAAT